MTTVNVTELRQHLPAYLKRAAAGEEILIASHGKIIARLLPEEDPSPRSSPESVPLLPGPGVLSSIRSTSLRSASSGSPASRLFAPSGSSFAPS